MPDVAGVAFAAALLLVVAGVSKVLRPGSLVSALGVVGLPRSRALVRAVSAGEVVLGGAALLDGRAAWWALTALAYLGFAGFVLAVRSRGDALATCGCFGGDRSPATRLHAVVTAGLALACAGTAAGSPAAATGRGALLLPSAVLVGGLVHATLTVLPATRAAAARSRRA